MARKVYLEGGGRHETGIYEGFERSILDSVNPKRIFVLDFARYGYKVNSRKERDKGYFERLGAEEIDFATDYNSPEEIVSKINQSEILYLPGGSTELLLEGIMERGLVPIIKSYPKVLVGNSAGAYTLCKEYHKIREEEVKTIPSLGVVDFSCKAHYKEDFDEELIHYSLKKDIYGIPEESAIIIEGDKLNFIKDIYLFSNGEKTKVN